MASNMINALKESSWLKSAEHDENYDCIYSVFPACRLDFGRGLQTRRLDVLVAENLTETNRNSVALRGIAVKNSKFELAIDVNSAEFIEFVDYFYIAVPDNPEMIETAQTVKQSGWGVIAMDPSGRIRVVVEPLRHQPAFRDITLSNIIIELASRVW